LSALASPASTRRESSPLAGATTEIVVDNPTDYFLYLPLMPQVAGGLVEPRHICVSRMAGRDVRRSPARGLQSHERPGQGNDD
jgi:hypothetical protein